jgi:hypothetical protein
MRTLRLTPLLAAAVLTGLFTIYYVKTVRWMEEGGFETGGASFPRVCWDLRSDIDVIVWRPFPESRPWGHSGWRLFYYGDAPEGTFALAYFPSWYLLVPLAALWGFGGFMMRDRRGRPNPAAPGNGATAVPVHDRRSGRAVPEPQL